jgi:hypothetical protein
MVSLSSSDMGSCSLSVRGFGSRVVKCRIDGMIKGHDEVWRFVRRDDSHGRIGVWDRRRCEYATVLPCLRTEVVKRR